ncbi:Uncharacterized protein PECH_002104 [Penicillium ucsense]|uniref:Importin N-terminal domain-containing protein n=1 Tax=Penicillium ucsense TaxID=2839758 RepID=A0A8J8W0Q2_9EURO|nr:Uncharacterized protein PECM_007208 [Penicillium ucsense]KAF7738060.1 Uncharacterized protein PECH_002104 [Penicillium ucsense]
MEQELLLLLADTQATSADTRHAAEAQLAQLKANESFPISLTAIASHESVPVNLRQSALSVLRTFITSHWSSNLDDFEGQVLVNDSNKSQIRRALLELATTIETPERKVKASASYAVSKIASADFPEDWPELLPTILQVINDPASSDNAVHGALKVLLDLVDTGFSDEQFFQVARDLVSSLFTVATSETRRPMLRALAVAVFRSCFDTLEMVLEQHKVAIKQFADMLVAGWSPYFVETLKAPLPQAPSPEEANKVGEIASQWRGVVALKVQIVKTLMKIRTVFPALLAPQSQGYFSTIWTELANTLPIYLNFYIEDERQGRLEDVDGLPYSLDYLVLEELDFLQTLLKAPLVKQGLAQQLQDAGAAASSTGWLPELVKLAANFAQITCEEEGLWEFDVNIFLAEETSVTANYTPRTCSSDLIIKLGDWLRLQTAEAVFAHLSSLYANEGASWKSQEASLYLLGSLLRDFGEETFQPIPEDLTNRLMPFISHAMGQGEDLLRARGYLTAGALVKAGGTMVKEPTARYLESALKAIAEDPSEVVKVACIRILQDLMPNLRGDDACHVQPAVISAISDYVSAHDLRDGSDSDDLKVTLAETLRDTIMVDSSVVLSTKAIDVLFRVASSGADNFQLTMLVTETFEDIVEQVSETGRQSYDSLCANVLPSFMAAMNVGDLTEEDDLTVFAADLLRALVEGGDGPLPVGFVETVMPKLTRLLMEAEEGELIRPVTGTVRHMLARDFTTLANWRDEHTGKGAVEVVLIIIDRLLGPSVDDNAATEVGQLAAELVERAGSQGLGEYLPQLLQAVAQRLSTAEQAQFIQSLVLVFARLTLISAQEVVDFLSQLNLNGHSGLVVVLSKWLENSVNFAGYDEIKQNIHALARLYELSDPRVAEVHVKGDLIISDTGRIKTRSQARANPDRYTTISAPMKIVKVLIEELAAASGNQDIDAAQAAALEDAASDDGDDEWEDEPGGGVMDLNFGMTKQQLMSFGEGGTESSFGVRRRDDATQAFLADFFRRASQQASFAAVFAALTPDEQSKLQARG